MEEDAGFEEKHLPVLLLAEEGLGMGAAEVNVHGRMSLRVAASLFLLVRRRVGRCGAGMGVRGFQSAVALPSSEEVK